MWKTLDCGLPADDSQPRPSSSEIASRPCLYRGCGLTVAPPDGVSWTRLRTVRGHGSDATAALLLPVHARGFAASVVAIDSYRVAVCCIHRDFFADAETFGTKG